MRNFYCSLARIMIGVSILVVAPLCALPRPLLQPTMTLRPWHPFATRAPRFKAGSVSNNRPRYPARMAC